MAIYKDVVVTVTRETAALTAVDLGKPLVLTTAADHAYQEFSTAAAVATEFGASSEAYKCAAAIFGQNPSPRTVAVVGIAETDPDDFTPVIDGLGTLFGLHNDWTYLLSTVRDMANMILLGQFCTANDKFYFGCITPESVDTFVNPASDRVAIMVHDHPETYPEAAWVGKCCIYEPGSATWKFKTLSGINPVGYDDQATEVKHIHDTKYNTYVAKYGLNMTSEGLLTSGEYIDIMLAVDWIVAEMELRVQSLLVRSPKVPFDNSGIALVAAEVESVLRDATTRSIFRRDEGGNGEYEMTVPDISEVPTNDIANRELNGITFIGYLAGAIHEVYIRGTVMY